MTDDWRLRLAALADRGQAEALCSVEARLGYAVLARRAGAIAATLREAGIAAGEPVALLFRRRGHGEPVALAAALGADAAVVPLDPHCPERRLASIIGARRCRALLHDEGARTVAAGLGGDRVRIELGSNGSIVSRDGRAAGVAVPQPGVACVLHTSGTTGEPKAVPIAWAGLAAFSRWMIDLTELRPGMRVLRVSELTFDLAWFDHVATWRAGATLATIERRTLASARALLEQVERLRPHVIYAVPSLFMKLVSALPDGRQLPDGLQVVCFAGEVFPPRELLALAERCPGARLINLFGPTETNVCTFHEVDRRQLDGRRELPIGIAPPYAACTLRAEDGSGRVVSGPGTGELVVAGPTALGGCFATGDRVERGLDGLFYFRGRIDRMVKIRGYRVQPAEVEAVLLEEPRLREAAVIVIDHPRLGLVLRGYVVLRDGAEPLAARELRAFVAGRLPAYMVPHGIEPIARMPRTSTGKIDYPALHHLASRS